MKLPGRQFSSGESHSRHGGHSSWSAVTAKVVAETRRADGPPADVRAGPPTSTSLTNNGVQEGLRNFRQRRRCHNSNKTRPDPGAGRRWNNGLTLQLAAVPWSAATRLSTTSAKTSGRALSPSPGQHALSVRQPRRISTDDDAQRRAGGQPGEQLPRWRVLAVDQCRSAGVIADRQVLVCSEAESSGASVMEKPVLPDGPAKRWCHDQRLAARQRRHRSVTPEAPDAWKRHQAPASSRRCAGGALKQPNCRLGPGVKSAVIRGKSPSGGGLND